MLSPVLSVLLLGMLPILGVPVRDPFPVVDISIAAPSPLLLGSASAGLKFDGRFSASGILIADFESGQVLYERAATVERPMASLTKLMTAIIIVENHSLSEIVTVPKDMKVPDAYLPPGQQFTVGDLLSALLIPSANDAAETLARVHSGSSENFSVEMNERAAAIGLQNTSFANPIGLDDPHQWSTPQDIAWLARYAMRYPAIAKRLAERGGIIRSRAGQPVYLTNTHAFLHADTPVVAGKTGTTAAAEQCLMSIVREGNRTYLVVLLHSLQRYKDMSVVLKALKDPSLL